jgi:hypothetical protein
MTFQQLELNHIYLKSRLRETKKNINFEFDHSHNTSVYKFRGLT